MPRFFTENISGDTARITGADAAHIARSLRMKPGEPLTVCDGHGTDYACEIEEARSDEVVLRVLEKTPNKSEPSLKVTLYQGLPKSDKMEWIIQKTVELGVFEIVPVETPRSIVRIGNDAARKQERWQRIADEAAGQSGRGICPTVCAPIGWKAALARMQNENTVVLYEGGGKPLGSLADRSTRAISLVVGAEGGFSSDEVAAMTAAGAKVATLGPRILRCETAPIAAITWLMGVTGNLDE